MLESADLFLTSADSLVCVALRPLGAVLVVGALQGHAVRVEADVAGGLVLAGAVRVRVAPRREVAPSVSAARLKHNNHCQEQ